MRSPVSDPRLEFVCAVMIVIGGGRGISSGQTGPCEAMPNGSFTAGFEGWTIVPSSSQSGNASEFHSSDIIDATQMFPPLDEHAAQVFIYTYALGLPSADSGGSAAAGQVVISTQATVQDRFLHMRTGGGFEILRMGGAETSLSARIEIRGVREAGSTIIHPIAGLTPPPFGPCEFGMSILGSMAAKEPVLIDLLEQDGQPTGIELGENILIDIIVSSSASSPASCDEGESVIALVIDQFEFCPPGGSIPGDVTGDGLVTVDDLLAVIESWGSCPAPPVLGNCAADLTGDGVVNVDDLLEVVNNWN